MICGREQPLGEPYRPRLRRPRPQHVGHDLRTSTGKVRTILGQCRAGLPPQNHQLQLM